MPFNEALFWFGLTAAGTGFYYLFEASVKRPLLHSVVTVVGVLACAYSVYHYHHPESPAIHLWVILLILTWAFLAYNIYLNRFRRLPSTENPKELSKLTIHRAVYGAGPQSDIDITDTLRNRAQDGLVIPVDNNLVGHDPAPNIRKRLELRYSYGDGSEHYVYRLESIQGDIVRLVLPEDSEVQNIQNLKKEVSHLQAKYSSEKVNDLNDKAKAENRAIQLETKLSELERNSVMGFSPLQKDAIELSRELLDFLKRLGPAPAPKYTAKEINDMPSAQMRPLIDAQDGDFLEAMEYHRPGGIAFTRQGLENQLTSHWTRLLPWYRKVEAAYALELKTKVQTMCNRFLMYGISDNGLPFPVEGKDAEKNIRAMASKFWELAYTIDEKGTL